MQAHQLLRRIIIATTGCLLFGIQITSVASVTSASTFDPKQALQTSQAAIGEPVGDYILLNTQGKPVNLSSYRGKPLVISMIYTSCYHICPTTTQHLKSVIKEAQQVLGKDSFNVITIGFDVFNDSPQAMRLFAAQQGVDMDNWTFFSIDQPTLDQLSRDVGFLYYASPHGFDHLIQATVVDADGKVYRQVYDMKFDTPKLVEPLKELVFGTPKGGSLITHIGNRIRLFCTVYDPKSGRYIFDYSIFIGMLIGLTTLGFVGFLVIKEWRKSKAGAA
ncbi:MAG TPA: SCO family protein [Gammaproteobacteria bacterium]|nr:SCO family protein [Gammaproteobacteria bacterium]